MILDALSSVKQHARDKHRTSTHSHPANQSETRFFIPLQVIGCPLHHRDLGLELRGSIPLLHHAYQGDRDAAR